MPEIDFNSMCILPYTAHMLCMLACLYKYVVASIEKKGILPYTGHFVCLLACYG